MQIRERIAASVLVSLVGGFLLTVALATSVNRAVLIWLLTVICSGLVVGGMETPTIGQAVKAAVLPALILSATPVLYFYFLSVIAFIENPKALTIQIPWGAAPDVVIPFDPFVIVGVTVLWGLCFIGSLGAATISMTASRLVLTAAQKMYRFGPKGLERVRLVILAVGGVLAALLSLLPVLAK